MNARLFYRLEDVARTIALGSSTVALLGLGAAVLGDPNRQLGFHIESMLAGSSEYKFPVLIGMVVAILAGYLLTFNKKLAELGGVMAVAGVAGMYYICNVLSGHTMGPEMIPLAIPAVFHLAAVELRRAAARSERSLANARGAAPVETDFDKKPKQLVAEAA